MSGATAYLARRAAQKERVRILYRRALKDTLNWAVHRHLFYRDASDLRDRFEANRDVQDLDRIDRMIAEAESTYNKFQHPDPYTDKLLLQFGTQCFLMLTEQFHGLLVVQNLPEIQHHRPGLR